MTREEWETKTKRTFKGFNDSVMLLLFGCRTSLGDNHHHDSRIIIFSSDYNHYLHSVHHVEMIHCIFRVHAWMTKLIKNDNDKATHLPPGHSCHHTSLRNTLNITTTMSLWLYNSANNPLFSMPFSVAVK